MQDRYLLRHFETIPDQLGGTKWTTLMITTTWRSVHTLWDLHNGQVYALDSSSRSQKQKEQVHRKLRALYILQSDMRHCDHIIFNATVEEHIEALPVWALKNWL